jgi:hypothetical protein
VKAFAQPEPGFVAGRGAVAPAVVDPELVPRVVAVRAVDGVSLAMLVNLQAHLVAQSGLVVAAHGHERFVNSDVADCVMLELLVKNGT